MLLLFDGRCALSGRAVAGTRAARRRPWARGARARAPDAQARPQTAPPQTQVVSPFTSANVQTNLDSEARASAEALTAESANAALDSVRPYLQADGGDCTVVSVQSGVVLVELVGACGTCTSSTATLKLGIEGALTRAFGDQVKRVLQVAKKGSDAANAAVLTDAAARADPARRAEAEVAFAKRVDEHLDKVRGPLEQLGGGVSVARFVLGEKAGEGGVVELKFHGPAALGLGIKQAVADQFPREVKEVVLVGG